MRRGGRTNPRGELCLRCERSRVAHTPPPSLCVRRLRSLPRGVRCRGGAAAMQRRSARGAAAARISASPPPPAPLPVAPWRRIAPAFALTYVAFAVCYLSRANAAAAKRHLAAALSLSDAALGALDALFLAAYALGNFALGVRCCGARLARRAWCTKR